MVASLPLSEPWASPDVLPFTRATVDPRPRIELAGTSTSIRYQVRDTSRGTTVVLSDDPSAEPRVPVLRLLANTVATFALVLTVGLACAATAPRFFGYESTVVESGSMEPNIKVADVVVTTESDGKNLGEGAVINFETDDRTTLHRIDRATRDGYQTSGDANPSPDSELVLPSQVRGVGTMVVPFVGLPKLWFDEGRWLLLAGMVATLVVFMFAVPARWTEGPRKMVRQ